MPAPLALSHGVKDVATQTALRQLEQLLGALQSQVAALSTSSLIKSKNGDVGATSGVFSDADFTSPADGLIGLDRTNNRLYVRTGGAWKSVALT